MRNAHIIELKPLSWQCRSMIKFVLRENFFFQTWRWLTKRAQENGIPFSQLFDNLNERTSFLPNSEGKDGYFMAQVKK